MVKNAKQAGGITLGAFEIACWAMAKFLRPKYLLDKTTRTRSFAIETQFVGFSALTQSICCGILNPRNTMGWPISPFSAQSAAEGKAEK